MAPAAKHQYLAATRDRCHTATTPRKPTAHKKRYHISQIITFLQQVSIASNMICSKRLNALIPLWLPYGSPPVDPLNPDLLLKISEATIDRLLAPWERRLGKLGLATTEPRSLPEKRILVKISQ